MLNNSLISFTTYLMAVKLESMDYLWILNFKSLIIYKAAIID